MKKESKVLIVSLVLLLFFSAAGIAQQDISVRFQIKYTGFDNNQNSYKEHVNISVDKPGNLAYVEEYYTVDSNNRPKFVSSRSFDAGEGIKLGKWYNASVDTLRPLPHGGKYYSLVKSVILLNNDRIFEYWLTRNKNFIDDTGRYDSSDSVQSEMKNIDHYEIEEGKISSVSTITLKYSTLEFISDVNVTGTGSDDLALRIDILKERDPLTDVTGGVFYKYFNIRADSVHIKNISINYKVDNFWMIEKDISPRKVYLLGWDSDNKVWVKLPTSIIDNDTGYTYYESWLDNPSKLAIVGLNDLGNKSLLSNSTSKTGDTIKSSPELSQSNDVKVTPGFEILIMVIALIFVYKKSR